MAAMQCSVKVTNWPLKVRKTASVKEQNYIKMHEKQDLLQSSQHSHLPYLFCFVVSNFSHHNSYCFRLNIQTVFTPEKFLWRSDWLDFFHCFVVFANIIIRFMFVSVLHDRVVWGPGSTITIYSFSFLLFEHKIEENNGYSHG